MTASAHAVLENRHLVTFRSRGVAAPFTTPMLASGRVRDSARAGVELVVPNPSGGRGVYVLQWPGVRALCNPTVHDTMLFQGLSIPATLGPATVRQTALNVAVGGFVGRDAAVAAEAAVETDRQQQLRAHFLLLTAVMEQVDPNGTDGQSPAERLADLDRRGSMVLHQLAPSFGRPAAELSARLNALGDAFAPLGFDRLARIPRLLDRLQQAAANLSGWLAGEPDGDIGGLGHAMVRTMRAAYASGAHLLDASRSCLDDPVSLLKRWCTDPDAIKAHAQRCDWLLDGWERVALVWMCATTNGARRATLLEMVPMMPVLPRDVTEWTDVDIPVDAMTPVARVTSHDDAWRSGGAAFALIERNEKMRAMSL